MLSASPYPCAPALSGSRALGAPPLSGPRVLCVLPRAPACVRFHALFLCAVQFTSGLARRALVGADDGLDHLLELGDLDAVLLGDVGKVEHPLDNRQLCQPLNLDSQATGLLLGVGEGDDFVVWGRFARIVHGSLAPPARG